MTLYIANQFDEKIIEFKERTMLLLENNLDSLREELIAQKIGLQ